jgi:type IV secretion system protein TrbB
MNAREQMRNRLEEQLCHDLGDAVLKLLDQSGVTDVLLLEDGTLWYYDQGKWLQAPFVTYEPEHREAIIGLVANSLRQEATFAHPIIEGNMEIDGRRFRFSGAMPPMVASPTVAIRKPSQIVYTLEDYERAGIISPRHRSRLEQAVRKRENILVAGAMGSGKSTLLNALLAAIPAHERVGIIEDVYELSAPHLPCKNHFHTSSDMTLRQVTRAALRFQLDRIIVGETRGAEALDMLKAWRVGCNGSMATIHANSATAALSRLGSLIQEADAGPQPHLIAEAIQLIVFIQADITETGLRRSVTEMVRVHSLNSDGEFYLTAA